jgi:F-type H+-transporting ATPase subunit b
MNGQIFILLAEESERGGLFDIGATLPLVAIQFLLLMFILNLILYNPLFTLMNQRNEYVLDNLSKASEMLRKATELTTQYEGELAETKKGAAKEISQSQKLQKEGFNTEVELSQKYLDTLVQKVLGNFATKKQIVLENLEPEINSLSTQMIDVLFKKTA